VHRAPDQAVALERARWLTELAAAAEQAQKLAWRLGVVEGNCEEARELYARLEAVRLEVDALRYGDWVHVRSEIDSALLESLIDQARSIAATNG